MPQCFDLDGSEFANEVLHATNSISF